MQILKDINFTKKKYDSYKGRFDKFRLHEAFMKDDIHINAYRQAIEGNPEDFKDKVVLDLCSGTGIFSIFAAKAGAKHVYAVENEDVVFFSREIVKQNGLDKLITVFKGRIEDIVLPVQHVDIIISNWMGYFLFFNSGINSVLWARDRYLAEGGKMLPDRA